ncbi:formate--phosphoribosylaminoimidazolecarboxamide ligase [Archaeoglobales archaeon]|nr:MAG: formate--phosphoribosylaminoimidazolecarboxamide ligase [Archaeoglobales archaeon]
MRDKILSTLENYDKDKIHIATLGSHSALNILKGAKDEGFNTICICRDKERIIYESFGVADEIIPIKDYPDLLEERLQNKLISMNVILIPHGSFNAYIGSLEKLRIPIFGNRVLMEWEVDRDKQKEWLEKAGVRLPKTYSNPEEIDGLAIVKFPGAMGGKGYFIVASKDDFYEKAEKMIESGLITKNEIKNAFIQEYVLGVNVYFSFFYSYILNRIELIAIDRRYESTVDALGKVPADIQIKAEIMPTYTVIGNFPIVLRESLLSQALRAAKDIVEVSKEIAYPGMVGPFCIESVFDENAEMTIFEISARIVAGTNVGIPSSPYSYILWGENMYMGRRIAREVRLAIEKDLLNEVVY